MLLKSLHCKGERWVQAFIRNVIELRERRIVHQKTSNNCQIGKHINNVRHLPTIQANSV